MRQHRRTGLMTAAAALVLAFQGTASAQIDATGSYTVGTLGELVLPYGTCTADVVQTGTAIEFSFDCIGGNFLEGTGTIDTGSGDFSITGTCDTSAPPPGPPAALTAYGTAYASTFVLYGTCQGLEVIYAGNKCGNGMIDAGEDCEDGNHLDGDCCSGTCTAETGNVCSAASPQCTVATCDASGTCVPGTANAAAGTQCDTDADLCSTEELCDGDGSCVATGGAVDCGGCASCDIAEGCVADWPEYIGAHPEPGECREANKEKAILANRLADDDRDFLNWSWKKSSGFPVADFGTPTAATGYTLCVYGEGNLDDKVVLGELAIPPGAGWASAPGGYRYAAELADGTKVKVDLRASAQDGKPRIKVKVKGAELGFPGAVDDAVHPFLQHGVIKLTADNGNCWASSMGVAKNSGLKGSSEKFNLKDCYPNFHTCR